MEFKAVKEPWPVDDFWYDLFEGGYVLPSKFLQEKEDIEQVNKAIETLKLYRDKGYELGIFEDM